MSSKPMVMRSTVANATVGYASTTGVKILAGIAIAAPMPIM